MRRRELGVAVVLAEEDHRQLPDRGEVDRLVERAVRDRAVAEERDRDAAVAAQLRGGRRARPRSAGPPPTIPLAPKMPMRRVGDVHRAAAPAVRALVLAHQLGEHPERVRPLARQCPWPRWVDVITSSRRERPARADGRRLLPDRQVHEARRPRRRGRASRTRSSNPRITNIVGAARAARRSWPSWSSGRQYDGRPALHAQLVRAGCAPAARARPAARRPRARRPSHGRRR